MLYILRETNGSSQQTQMDNDPMDQSSGSDDDSGQQEVGASIPQWVSTVRSWIGTGGSVNEGVGEDRSQGRSLHGQGRPQMERPQTSMSVNEVGSSRLSW